ncbi:hypothetical protein RB595_000336 [Gaeumannomyces hyphopodioides]
MSTSPVAKVLVIGCGVAGPVVACLLKQKGYRPIVFERAPAPGDIGQSIIIAPNGMKVLAKACPSVIDRFLENGPPVCEFREHKASGEVLGWFETGWEERYGKPGVGAKRTTATTWLRDALVEAEIEIRDGWGLERIEEAEDGGSVTAFFDGGRSETGLFLVGCDGLKSATRRLLLDRGGLKDGSPSFTGICQTGGLAPTPASFRDHRGVRNYYGESLHFVCYDISQETVSWALTQRAVSGTEVAWGLFDDASRQKTTEELGSMLENQGWDPTVVEMIRGATRLIRYGIFDRPELPSEQWFSGRCVMVGDAVHPTSTHLGQGGNQACEDCYYLAEALPSFDPAKPPISTSELSEAFRGYAEKQQPHTSHLVKAARAVGELRVTGPEGREARDKLVAERAGDRARIDAHYDFQFRRPY